MHKYLGVAEDIVEQPLFSEQQRQERERKKKSAQQGGEEVGRLAVGADYPQSADELPDRGPAGRPHYGQIQRRQKQDRDFGLRHDRK